MTRPDRYPKHPENAVPLCFALDTGDNNAGVLPTFATEGGMRAFMVSDPGFYAHKDSRVIVTYIQPGTRVKMITRKYLANWFYHEMVMETDETPIIEPPNNGSYMRIPVEANYKGHSFSALLFFGVASSKVLFRGIMGSLSTTGANAMKLVNPEASAPNGWDFWKVSDPIDGRLRPASDLRDDEVLVTRIVNAYNQYRRNP